jgi:3-polyprenyl-4-hydroxybenzoate decarboxylase
MHYLARAGAVIFPPSVSYYARPASVDEMTNYVVGRIVDQLGIEHSMIERWKDGTQADQPAGGAVVPIR